MPVLRGGDGRQAACQVQAACDVCSVYCVLCVVRYGFVELSGAAMEVGGRD